MPTPLSDWPLAHVFPFAALVGQTEAKLALVLCAINPRIGGVLIAGEKGTAKSTAVRGLAALLPPIACTRGCPFACDPVDEARDCPHGCGAAEPATDVRPTPLVTLPLNATEERVVGGIDFQSAMRSGRPVFQPGLLASAHRGVLYIDEVNLMDDHLVDLLLDASASGENRVEREGLSVRHPSRFTLVGTMNPEEGSLRPQLLDRFGLFVRLGGLTSVNDRLLLMERRESFDADPVAFTAQWRAETEKLAAQIRGARALLPRVRIDDSLRRRVAEMAVEQGVAGHRADLVMAETVLASAAWKGQTCPSSDDLEIAASLALPHRRRETQPVPPPQAPRPPDQTETEDDKPEDPSDGSRQDGEASASAGRGADEEPDSRDAKAETSTPRSAGEGGERVFGIGETFRARRLEAKKDRRLRRGSGRRSRTRTAQKQGRYVRPVPDEKAQDIALDATLRAAAPFQRQRPRIPGLALNLRPGDLRRKVREKRVGHFVLFLVDASGSMGARGRMSAAKGAILSLLLDAYQRRDRVAMVSFRGQDATVNLPPTASVDLAARRLAELPVGGRTPLAAGLAKAYALVERVLRATPTARPFVVLLTDGKANQSLERRARPVDEALAMARRWRRDERVVFVVVDTEASGLVRFCLARSLAEALGADYFPMEHLRADTLLDAVKRSI